MPARPTAGACPGAAAGSPPRTDPVPPRTGPACPRIHPAPPRARSRHIGAVERVEAGRRRAARKLTHVVGRILAAVPVLIGVTTAVFSMLFLVPGDPVKMMPAEFVTTPDQVAQMRAQLTSTTRFPSSTAGS